MSQLVLDYTQYATACTPSHMHTTHDMPQTYTRAHRLTHAHTCTPYMKHSAHHRHVLFFHRTQMSQPTNARSPSSSNVQYCAPRLRPHCNTARRDCGRIINDAPRLRTLLVLVPDRARRAPRLQVLTCVARIYSICKSSGCN